MKQIPVTQIRLCALLPPTLGALDGLSHVVFFVWCYWSPWREFCCSHQGTSSVISPEQFWSNTSVQECYNRSRVPHMFRSATTVLQSYALCTEPCSGFGAMIHWLEAWNPLTTMNTVYNTTSPVSYISIFTCGWRALLKGFWSYWGSLFKVPFSNVRHPCTPVDHKRHVNGTK